MCLNKNNFYTRFYFCLSKELNEKNKECFVKLFGVLFESKLQFKSIHSCARMAMKNKDINFEAIIRYLNARLPQL